LESIFSFQLEDLLDKDLNMKALKIVVLSTAIAFAPAAMAQVVEYPPETIDEQAPETTQEVDTAEAQDVTPDTVTPETTAPDNSDPETKAPKDRPSEPMAL
jgi:hypothetical protein